MANDCLITKLKGFVDNPNLPIFGKLLFRILPYAEGLQKRLLLTVSEAVDISIVNGIGTITYGEQSGDTVHIAPNISAIIYFSSGDYVVSISNKYVIKNFTMNAQSGYDTDIDFDINQLTYSENLYQFAASGAKHVHGDIEIFSGKQLTTLIISGTNVTGDWGVLTDMPLERFSLNNKLYGTLITYPQILTQLSAEYNNNITGIIDDLSSKTNLVSVSLQGCQGISGGNLESLGNLTSLTTFYLTEMNTYSGFNGTVEGFVAAQVANDRASVTVSSPIYCPWLLRIAKFGGNNYGDIGRMWLTWESVDKVVTKIIIYQGGNTIDTFEKVYAKGASSSEIDAWIAAGKNVVVIN